MVNTLTQKRRICKIRRLENVEPAESEESKKLLLSEEASLSLMLLQLNGTEGLGCVKRIAEVERIEQDIGHYIEVALQGMIQAEPRFSYTLLKALRKTPKLVSLMRWTTCAV